MLSFQLPYPPTVNLYWRVWKGRPVLSSKGRAYRTVASEFAPASPLVRPVWCIVHVVLPDHRKRDLDNILKAILDALVHGGILEDDSQIESLIVQRGSVEKIRIMQERAARQEQLFHPQDTIAPAPYHDGRENGVRAEGLALFSAMLPDSTARFWRSPHVAG